MKCLNMNPQQTFENLESPRLTAIPKTLKATADQIDLVIFRHLDIDSGYIAILKDFVTILVSSVQSLEKLNAANQEWSAAITYAEVFGHRLAIDTEKFRNLNDEAFNII